MKIAVVSDIHGNMEAFNAVLKDIKRHPIDGVITLGDNIGYGPDPEQVIKQIIEYKITSIVGNHEMAVRDPHLLKYFNKAARKSLLQTRKMLSTTSKHYISKLHRAMTYQQARFVHGFPPDKVNTYLFEITGFELIEQFNKMKEHICFVGHTHELLVMGYDGKTVNCAELQPGIRPLRNNSTYIVNVGSVGQPRDGDNNAKYVIWDTELDTIELRHIAYDIAVVVKKIIKAGLPRQHAERLWGS